MQGRSFILGVTLPDIRNPLFAEILNGLVEEVGRARYQCILAVVEAGHGEKAILEVLIDLEVKGIAMVGAERPEIALRHLTDRVPLVANCCHSIDSLEFDTVNNDDFEGARCVIRHLVVNNFRNIAMLSLEAAQSTVVAKREAGYRLAMAASNLGAHIAVH